MADILPEVAELLKAGFTAKGKGDLRVARALFQAGVDEARKRRNPEGEARSLLELSAVVIECDKDLKLANRMLNDCLKIYTKLRSDRGRAYAMSNLGSLAFDEGDLREAWRWQGEALALFEKEQDKYGMAMAFHQMGKIKHQQDDFPSAEKYWRKSLLLFQGTGRNYGTGQTLLSLGVLYLDQYKDLEQAKAMFARAQTVFEELGLSHEAAKARHDLAIIERLENQRH